MRFSILSVFPLALVLGSCSTAPKPQAQDAIKQATTVSEAKTRAEDRVSHAKQKLKGAELDEARRQYVDVVYARFIGLQTAVDASLKAGVPLTSQVISDQAQKAGSGLETFIAYVDGKVSPTSLSLTGVDYTAVVNALKALYDAYITERDAQRAKLAEIIKPAMAWQSWDQIK